MRHELPVGENDLHAAADDRLPPERKKMLEAHLAANPEDAARLAFYRALNEALRRLHAPALSEPVPQSWLARRPRGGGVRLAARVGALAAALALAMLGGWFLRGFEAAPETGSALPKLALRAHSVYAVEARHPVEVSGEDEAHLVQWLGNRLGRSVDPPGLDRFGFSLLGGRLLPAEDGLAAQIMYENEAGNRLTLYVASGFPNTDNSELHFVQSKELSVYYWRDGAFGFAAVADITPEALKALCGDVYAQFDAATW